MTISRGPSALGALALLALVLIAAPALTAADPALREGVHEGVHYVISVPAQWNGGLVMFAHGYEGEGLGRGSVRGSTLAGHLTAIVELVAHATLYIGFGRFNEIIGIEPA